MAIARALANDPSVLVADEPTGNFESRRVHRDFDLLESLTERGKSVRYMTHDPELAARAASRVNLLDARVIGRAAVSVAGVGS